MARVRSFALTLSLAAAVEAFGPSLSCKTRATTNLGATSYLEKLNLGEDEVYGGTIIDEERRLQGSNFPISPEELIDLAKHAVTVGVGMEDESVLADNFEYHAPFKSVMDKDEYLELQKSLELETAFPDLDNQYYNFHVDPFEFNRVWYTIRPIATHSGSLQGKKPTGKSIELPPQAQSLTFDKDGKVIKMTASYVMDTSIGNTGGLGGAMGFFAGVGQA